MIDKKRATLVLYIFMLAFLALAVRLFYLQVVRHSFFLEKSIDQRTRLITLAADRGDIFDRNGNVLGTSVDVFSVYLVPGEISSREATAGVLSRVLGLDYQSVLKQASRRRAFVWLKRKISRAAAENLLKKDLQGVGFLSEKKRVYPKGSLASQTLGFVGIDNQGLAGIELGFDEKLKGKEGRMVLERDPAGFEIAAVSPREIEKATDGMNLTLTIDENIQYISEKELKAALHKHKAVAGSIIMMNPRTGEILSIASYPDFDGNRYSDYAPKTWKLAPITNIYEPGSTLKVITAAMGINEGLYQPQTIIGCPPEYKVGAATIKNSHSVSPNPKVKTLTDVIAESINTGILQVGLKVGSLKFYDYLKSFGFGARIELGFPGQPAGILREPRYWYQSDLPMMTFGQTIGVTPLQMIAAFSALANDGIRVAPFLVKKIESLDGMYVKTFAEGEKLRVISKETAEKVKQMMEAVVYKRNGTGHLSKLKYWQTAGKSGTAQKSAPGGGYLKGRYLASFIGFAPSADPQVLVLITIDEPQGTIWGATTAAPMFKNVVEWTLRYLNTPPSRLP